jgi:predicted DNA-binding transcriptional regulator YafY
MKSTKTRRAERLGERLLALPQLLQTRRWSQKELMEYFGVDRKTIISDINTLSNSNPPTPISEEREGRQVYYRLRALYRPRLTFEAEQLFFGGREITLLPSADTLLPV